MQRILSPLSLSRTVDVSSGEGPAPKMPSRFWLPLFRLAEQSREYRRGRTLRAAKTEREKERKRGVNRGPCAPPWAQEQRVCAPRPDTRDATIKVNPSRR